MAIIKTDKNRILLQEASPDKIIGKWKDAVDEVIETYKNHLGDKLISVYVGGSVGVGTAIEGKSDLDTYAVTYLNKEETEEAYDDWINTERKRIDEKFPFQRGVELHLWDVDDMSDKRKFKLRLVSAYVYGKDFYNELPDFILDIDTIRKIRLDIVKQFNMAKIDFDKHDDSKTIKEICAWVAKRIIRQCGMLVIWKEDFFTVDLEPVIKIFIKYYPEKEIEIKRAFDYVNEPTDDKKEILDFIDSFGEWIIEEDEKIFA